jgi:hypothetical protein
MELFTGRVLSAIIVIGLSMSLAGIAASQAVPIAPCSEGESRPCGSSVGECEKGTTSCLGGGWGDCQGGVKAVKEECGDGLDNDCNGIADDCGFNMVSMIMIGSGVFLLIFALVLSKLGK